MTVKTQNAKVILKGGKVSCSCCEAEECCMYSNGSYLDGLITYDDLPDSIKIGGIEYPKTSSSYSIGGDLELLIPSDSNNWEFVYQGLFVGLAFECIPFGEMVEFYDPMTGDFLDFGECEDAFAESYNVSGPISGIVTRESICVWRGTGLTLTNFDYQWQLNGNNKSGFQNTPVGSYAGGYSVS